MLPFPSPYKPIILRAPRRGVVCARLRAKLKILGFASSVTVTQFLSHHLQSGKRHIKTSGRVLGESQVNTWPHSTFNFTTGGNKHSKVDSAHLNWQISDRWSPLETLFLLSTADSLKVISKLWLEPGNTKEGSITLLLTSCFPLEHLSNLPLTKWFPSINILPYCAQQTEV